MMTFHKHYRNLLGSFILTLLTLDTILHTPVMPLMERSQTFVQQELMAHIPQGLPEVDELAEVSSFLLF